MLTFAITPTIQERRRQLRSRKLPVVGSRESRVGINLRHRLSLLKDLLQSEQMTIDTLTVCSPSSVLQMPGDGFTEQSCTVLILWMEQTTTKIKNDVSYIHFIYAWDLRKVKLENAKRRDVRFGWDQSWLRSKLCFRYSHCE